MEEHGATSEPGIGLPSFDVHTLGSQIHQLD